MNRRSLLLVLAAVPLALGASRPRYGGDLRLVAPEAAGAADPALSDAPADAALSLLAAPPVCRLDVRQQARPVLAQELSALGPLRVRVELGANRTVAPSPAAVAERWERLSRTATLSPYRALLFAVRGEGRSLAGSANRTALELSLAFPFPDFERGLCHPALGVPGSFGAFTTTRVAGQYLANPTFALGRPFVQRALVSAVTDREAARLINLAQADVVLSPPEDTAAVPPPALYATYLAFRPSRVGPELRQSVEGSVDRADLTRFFVRGPAVPMSALLPPALMPQPPLPRPANGGRVTRDVTLLYDAASDDQRAVAERLQVRLHDRGYRVALSPLSREALRKRWATGDFDLMLHAALLPPVPSLALAIVLDLAGRHDLLASELPPLGLSTDASARDALARQRAEALRDGLSLIPLYAQGLGVRATPKVQALDGDGFGLPILDGAFLNP